MAKRHVFRNVSCILAVVAVMCACMVYFWHKDQNHVEAATKNKTTVNCQYVYQNPYAVQLLWYDESIPKGAEEQMTMELSNGKQLDVFFTHATVAGMKEQTLLDAMKVVLEGQITDEKSYLNQHKSVMVMNYANVGADVEKAIKKCYKHYNLWQFNCLFPQLTDEQKSKYASKAYKDDLTAYFDVARTYLTSDEVQSFIKKAFEDQKSNVIALLANNIDKKQIKTFLEQAYKDGYWEIFSVLKNKISTKDIRSFMAKALKDGNLDKIFK